MSWNTQTGAARAPVVEAVQAHEAQALYEAALTRWNAYKVVAGAVRDAMLADAALADARAVVWHDALVKLTTGAGVFTNP